MRYLVLPEPLPYRREEIPWFLSDCLTVAETPQEAAEHRRWPLSRVISLESGEVFEVTVKTNITAKKVT